MLSGSNEQHSRCNGKVDHVLHHIEEVVEHRHQGRRKTGRREQRSRRNWEWAAKSKAELQKLNPLSPRKISDKYLHNLRGAEVRRAAQYAHHQAGMTIKGLTNREGKQANMSQEMEDMLRHEKFTANANNQYYELPPAGSTFISAA
jgi:hypothetical protein